MIESQDIAKALISLIEDDKKDADKVASDFIGFMKKYNLENRITSVLFHLEAELKRQNEKKKATITLAQETSEELIEKIKRSVNIPENAITEIQYNKSLIAGFRAYFKDKLYEANIEKQLQELKKAVSSG